MSALGTSRPDPDAVLALADAAESADGVAPLSEAWLLALGEDSSADRTHLTADGASAGALAGYAQVDPTGATELVVHPDTRRHGLGRALWQAALAAGASTAWAHGDLPAARALAERVGLDRVRELHRMERALTADDQTDAVLPQGFSARTFVPGQDDEAWVALNAAAFAHHREQGRLDLADLRSRIAQPWFDADGFFLVTDDAHPEAGPVAFHWTKVEAHDEGAHGTGRAHGSGTDEGAHGTGRAHGSGTDEGAHGTGRAHGSGTDEGAHGTGRAHGSGTDEGAHGTGEVYVVGVHPAYQGRGLARPLTRLGTSHLARQGLAAVELYVDGDNTAALATYRKEGFTSVAIDAMYAVPGTMR